MPKSLGCLLVALEWVRVNLKEVKFSSWDSYYGNKKIISGQTVEKKGRVCVCVHPLGLWGQTLLQTQQTFFRWALFGPFKKITGLLVMIETSLFGADSISQLFCLHILILKDEFVLLNFCWPNYIKADQFKDTEVTRKADIGSLRTKCI